MRKIIFIALFIFAFSTFVYASWTEYKNIRYLDFDGDFIEEIIIESKHGAGSNHYIEDMRIYQDEYPDLKLIFHIRTLDSYFGHFVEFIPHDIISEVEFTEPDIESGRRDIIVKSRKIYYKNNEFQNVNDGNVDREEDLGVKIYKWDGEKFVESEEANE